jgi:copper(I)-binding protein
MLSRRFLLAATAALTLAASLPAQAEDMIHVHDAYARSMGGVGASGAVFMQLMNHSSTDDRLVAAKSDVAEKLELHTHKMTAEGVMQMIEIEGGVPLPAGATHPFERGADHVMLLGLTRELKDGDSFALTLVFESGAEVTVDVPVDNARKPGKAMEDHDHSSMGG